MGPQVGAEGVGLWAPLRFVPTPSSGPGRCLALVPSQYSPLCEVRHIAPLGPYLNFLLTRWGSQGTETPLCPSTASSGLCAPASSAGAAAEMTAVAGVGRGRRAEAGRGEASARPGLSTAAGVLSHLATRLSHFVPLSGPRRCPGALLLGHLEDTCGAQTGGGRASSNLI